MVRNATRRGGQGAGPGVETLRYIREHEALQYILRNEPEEIVRTLVSTKDAAGPTLIHLIINAAIPDLEPEIAAQLYPNPAAAAEFMVRTIYSFMLIPEGAISDADAADLVVRAIVRRIDSGPVSGVPAWRHP